ncbi:oxygenase MpaB family protein [Streptomyces goshikiensis]|uniref:oxygenase MpaB family protein n=1 Tax=Streptomyces goshikiensis TaxID=1942 RepID=UPI003D9E0E43
MTRGTTVVNATQTTPPRPARYDEAALDVLATRGDPLADATVATLIERGEVGDLNTLMRFFSTSGDKLPEWLPAAAAGYFEATAMPPDWVDWEVMERARLFFTDNAAHINTGLAFAAMPVTYAVPRLARLLSSTHSLAYPSRRMAGTGQFVTYLMRSDSFEEGGKFIPAAQKVRLLHAAVRHHLRGGGHWDVARDGTPICQEDMIGGFGMFSLLVLDAMHRLGVHMTEEGAEAYFYAWRVVAAMLGCDMSAVPGTLPECRAYLDLYLRRGLGPSPEGVELTTRLTRLYEDVVPGTLFDPMVPATIRYLVGDTISGWLEVPRSPWDAAARAVPVFLGLLETIEDSGPLAEWALDKAGSALAGFELSSLTRGRVMHHAIPEELRPEYGMKAPRTGRWIPPAPVH